MRCRFAKAIAIIIITFINLGGFVLSAQSEHADGDSVQIKSIIQGFTDAFNRHDGHATAVWFTEDADFTNIQQATSHGRKEIEEHFIAVFKTRLMNAHRTYTVTSIRFLTPNVATITMNYDLAGMISPTGDAVPPYKGLYHWVVTKSNGKWLIDVMEEAEVVKPPSGIAK